MTNVITLLTDFGNQDSYVAQMKGIILTINPNATIVDITHEVRPQNIRQASRILDQTAPCFPSGTIHIAVVDPGVGTERRIIAGKIGRHFYVMPDNGLLTGLARTQVFEWCVVLEQPSFWRSEVSSTFHGRDIMAPVAAHLSLGVEPASLGSPIPEDTLVRFGKRVSKAASDSGQTSLEVLDVDHFGNVVLDREGEHALAGGHRTFILKAGTEPPQTVRIVKTYGDAENGELVALIGSFGEWELAVVGGSAAKMLGIGASDRVYIENSGV